MLYCDHQNDFCSGLRGEIFSISEFPSDGTSYVLCQPHTNLGTDQKEEAEEEEEEEEEEEGGEGGEKMKKQKKKKGVRVGRR